jgi:nitrogen-specific signal transduction histidine kinase
MPEEVTSLVELSTAAEPPLIAPDAWAPGSEAAAILDAVAQIVVVLDAERRIVFANAAALAATGARSVAEVIGRRLGESLACERAVAGGCGAADGCGTCGALRSIVSAELGGNCEHDCRLLQVGTARAMQFRVAGKPAVVGGEQYTMVTLTDISHESRRRNLERIFFHDLLNTAGAMSGYLQLIDSVDGEERDQVSRSLLRLIDTLVEEIRSQRDLMLAENGELPVRPSEFRTMPLLKEVVANYRNQPAADGKFIFVAEGTADAVVRSDRGLLVRALGNLVKNALEASVSGDHVLIGCDREADGLVFWVHNRVAMPREVQLQMFHRAYSTKGSGRGLGTYSVKLLTTHYLAGKVGFSSTPQAGTRFFIKLPVTLPAAP